MFNRGKHCVFTINNPTELDEELLCDENVNYCIYGYETGDTGTPHLQGYAQFSNQLYLSAVKLIMPRAHIEMVKGTQV